MGPIHPQLPSATDEQNPRAASPGFPNDAFKIWKGNQSMKKWILSTLIHTEASVNETYTEQFQAGSSSGLHGLLENVASGKPMALHLRLHKSEEDLYQSKSLPQPHSQEFCLHPRVVKSQNLLLLRSQGGEWGS